MRSITAQSASSVIGSGQRAAQCPGPGQSFNFCSSTHREAPDPSVDGFGSFKGSATIRQKAWENVADAYGVRTAASVEGLFVAAATFFWGPQSQMKHRSMGSEASDPTGPNGLLQCIRKRFSPQHNAPISPHAPFGRAASVQRHLTVISRQINDIQSAQAPFVSTLKPERGDSGLTGTWRYLLVQGPLCKPLAYWQAQRPKQLVSQERQEAE